MTFDKAITIVKNIVVTLLILFLIYQTYSFFKVSKENKEFEAKNKILFDRNVELENSIEKYKLDIVDYEKKIAEKKVEIIYKEKIVYRDGKIIIPEDYVELKKNYLVLSDLYTDTKELLNLANIQIEKDGKLIRDLDEQNKDLLNQLQNIPGYKKKFLTHSILFGYGQGEDTFYTSSYQLTVYEKIHVQLTVGYPQQVSVSLGMKL